MTNFDHFDPEEHKSENDRLYGKDKAHQTFVPSEALPDDDLLPDQFEDREKEQEGDDEVEIEPVIELTREEKIEQLQKEIKFSSLFTKQKLAQLQKEPVETALGYHRGEGVASVGPDIKEEEMEVPTIAARETPADEIIPSGKMAASIVEPLDYVQRRHRRNSGTEHDNLKTITDSKKARSWRDRIRNLFHSSQVDPRVEAFEDYNPNEIEDDPFEYKEDKVA